MCGAVKVAQYVTVKAVIVDSCFIDHVLFKALHVLTEYMAASFMDYAFIFPSVDNETINGLVLYWVLAQLAYFRHKAVICHN